MSETNVHRKPAFPTLSTLRRRVTKDPAYQNLINLASGQRRAGMLDAAVATLSQCLEVDRFQPEAWNNLAQVYTDLGKFEQAPLLFQRALQCNEKLGKPPEAAHEVLLGFAYSMMRLEQFQYIWPVWEAARLNTSWHCFPGLFPWKGEEIHNLLVVVEGGFGDGFNFLRWIPRTFHVPSGGPTTITLIVWDPLFDYVAHVFSDQEYWNICVLPMSHSLQYDELKRFTHITSIMSLPAYCGMSAWGDIPPPLDWTPPNAIVAPPNDWIGFCWKAEENGVQRRSRSLDILTADRVARKLTTMCERVVSLCPTGKHLYREDDELERPARAPKSVDRDASLIDSWEQTARTILRCKLVVTVDTAICHLSGSLGVPTLLLLPVRSDWKWGLERQPETVQCSDGTWAVEHHGFLPPWYGQNFRAFRNTNPTAWDAEGIINAINKENS